MVFYNKFIVMIFKNIKKDVPIKKIVLFILSFFIASTIIANDSKKIEDDFLRENARKPGIIVTASGLQYEIINAGAGSRPVASDSIRFNYLLTLIDGTILENYMYCEPLELIPELLIKGMEEGLLLMRVGSKYRFFIPSALAYGSNGMGRIPPYTVFILEVELHGINE